VPQEALVELLGKARFDQFHFHHFIDSRDSDGQCRGEADPRLRVIPFAHAELQPGTPEPPLETPGQIPVPDQAQVSLLAKTNAYSLQNHSVLRFPPLPLAAGKL